MDSVRGNEKKALLIEIAAIVAVIVVLLAVPVLTFGYHRYVVCDPGEAARTIELFGVGRSGVWTTEAVNAVNYGWKNFTAATLTLRKDEKVLLRLHSSDVHHRFYIPALEVGPVEVEPGHIAEIVIFPRKEGIFEYYCTALCGHCHFYMKGMVVVGKKTKPDERLIPICRLHLPAQPEKEGELPGRGALLFESMGCITCHGEAAVGNVANYNYAKKTIPPLNTLAQKMFLTDADEVEKLIGFLGNNAAITEESPVDLRNRARVVAQYNSIMKVMHEGSEAGMLDSLGVAPPLHMPAWYGMLKREEMNALVAYLLTLQPWEEDDEW